MRIPLVPQLNTKDGVTDNNGRMTNVLAETDESGQLACVRPGLVQVSNLSGSGKGLVSFNDALISVYESTLKVTDNNDLTMLGFTGTLSGNPNAYTTGCTSDGAVVVGYGTNDSGGYAWVNDGGTYSTLDSDGAVQINADAIAALDPFYISGSHNAGSGIVVPVLWYDGILSYLPKSSYGGGRTTSISSNGVWVTGYLQTGMTVVPVVWENQSLTILGQLSGTTGSTCVSVSDDGVAVGYATVSQRVAVRWDSGVPSLIPGLTSYTRSEAVSISNDGAVIWGEARDVNDLDCVWRWTAPTGTVVIGNFRDVAAVSYDGVYALLDRDGDQYVLYLNSYPYKYITSLPFPNIRGISSDASIIVGHDNYFPYSLSLIDTKNLTTLSGDFFDFSQSVL